MRWHIIPALLLALLFSGCEVRRPVENPEAAPAVPLVAGTPGAAHVADIGDVEAELRIEGFLVDTDTPAGVQAEYLETPKQTISLCTIEVSPPHPPELWLTFRVFPARYFDGQALAVRGIVFREQGMPAEEAETIETFYALLAIPSDHLPIPEPYMIRVNAFSGLESLPVTMLIHAEMEVLLLPRDTDAAEVNPATVVVDAGRTTGMLSNPIRINITPGDASS